MDSTKPRIAFFGLGTMGDGMARRLLNAGFALSVWNRSPEKARALASLGATPAATPREAAKNADILIAIVADDTASRALWLGENGALAGAKAGAICIDCSTLTVPWVKELAAAAQAKNLKFLDAPVTGTKPHAASGELTFLVGGDAAALETARPALAVMSKQIAHLGPTAAGAAFKLVNNFLCGVQAASLAHAIALLQSNGLDLQQAIPLLVNGAPGSPIVKTLATRHTTTDATVNFQLQLLRKDLAYSDQLATAAGFKLDTARAAINQFDPAIAAGFGEQDISAIIRFALESQAKR